MIGNMDHEQLLVSGEVGGVDLETITTGVRSALELSMYLPFESKQATTTCIADEDDLFGIVTELKHAHVSMHTD